MHNPACVLRLRALNYLLARLDRREILGKDTGDTSESSLCVTAFDDTYYEYLCAVASPKKWQRKAP